MRRRAPHCFRASTSAARTAFSPSNDTFAAPTAPRRRRSATASLHVHHPALNSRFLIRFRAPSAITNACANFATRSASARLLLPTTPFQILQVLASRLRSTRSAVAARSRNPARRYSLAASASPEAIAPARASDRQIPSRRDNTRCCTRSSVPLMRATPVTIERDVCAPAWRMRQAAVRSRSRWPRTQRWRAARRAVWRRDIAGARAIAARQRSHALRREARAADASDTCTALAALSWINVRVYVRPGKGRDGYDILV